MVKTEGDWKFQREGGGVKQKYKAKLEYSEGRGVQTKKTCVE